MKSLKEVKEKFSIFKVSIDLRHLAAIGYFRWSVAFGLICPTVNLVCFSQLKAFADFLESRSSAIFTVSSREVRIRNHMGPGNLSGVIIPAFFNSLRFVPFAFKAE